MTHNAINDVSCHQRGFLLQQMGMNSETHSHSIRILEHIVINGTSSSNLPTQKSGNPSNIESEKVKDQRRWRTTGEQGPISLLSKAHRNHRTKQQAHRQHWSASSSVHIFQLSVQYFYRITECVTKWISYFSWVSFSPVSLDC